MLDGVALSKYIGVVAALIGAGMGLPIPEEIPIATAGAFVGHDSQSMIDARVAGQPIPPGMTHWWIMLPVCIVAVVASDSILYFAGRWFGPWLLSRKWVQKRILTPEKRAKIEANFEKRGVMILLGARFTPGIRTPVFLMAGVLRMPLYRFLMADALYAIPGVNLLFWLAYWFTDQFLEAITAAERHKPLIVVAVLAAVGGALVYKLFVGRKVSTGDPDEIPSLVKPVGVVTHAVEQTIEKTVERTGSAAAFVFDKVTHPFGHHEKSGPPLPRGRGGQADGGLGRLLPPVPPDLTFDALADHLLNRSRLIVGGRSHRLIEVEAYYHSAAHPDPFAHRHPVQLHFGRWYFHRSGASYRGGSFKGLDVTIGGPSAYGGMLLRGLETPDGTVIDGPSLLVDHLLATAGMSTVAELDAAIGERWVTDADSPLSLVPHADERRPVWKSLRVGLSLKRQVFRPDDPAIGFLLLRDRYLTEPRRTKKGKPHLVMPLLAEGRSVEEIRAITGCPPSTIQRYQAEMEAGKAEASAERYYGAGVGTRELCRLFGRHGGA